MLDSRATARRLPEALDEDRPEEITEVLEVSLTTELITPDLDPTDRQRVDPTVSAQAVII